MKEISVDEAHASQRNQVGIYKMLHGEGIYKVQLLIGYNNGASGKWLKAKSIRELKNEVEKIRLGLTRGEINRLSESSSSVAQKEKEKHPLHRELIIEEYHDVDLPDQLRIIGEFSEKKRNSEIYPSLIQYKASGEPIHNYTGLLDYTQYKYAFRKLRGVKQADITLYEMKRMDRSKLIKKLVQNTWDRTIIELEEESGKILTNKYLIVNEVEELIGLFSCKEGEVFLKSLPIYSILDSPCQFIQARR